MFTAFLNRPHNTVVTHKAVLSNVVDHRTTDLVHDLKIGNDNVQFIYTRVFDFVVQSGPSVASASFVIRFQPDLKIFGMEAIPPAKVRPDWMKCQRSPFDASAVVCDLLKSCSGRSQPLPVINSDQSAAPRHDSKPDLSCRNPPLRQISGQENSYFFCRFGRYFLRVVSPC